jgi:peptidoglycan/LPS O-acetylase OafA/YrhL
MYKTHQELVQLNNKLLGLEVIRFISALSVLVWHYQHFFYKANIPTNFINEKQPLYDFFSLFYNYGGSGVQVFWCVSGFIFFWKYRETISSNAITFKSFFVLRFSRLYPLHIFTLMLVLSLQAIYYSGKEYFFVYQNNNTSHFIYHLFLASNWWGFEIGSSFNGPVWSISVEVLVYFFFFLILKKISKSFLINVGVLLLCLAAKHLKIPSQIFDCLALFYIGGLSAIALKQIQSTKYYKKILYIALFFLLASPLLINCTKIYQHKYFVTLFFMSYTPVLLFFSAQQISVSPLIQKTIEAAGNMTYSIYLIHFPLQLAIAIYFMAVEQEIPYYSKVFFAGFMFTTVFISYFIYRLFELPVQNTIRKKWL